MKAAWVKFATQLALDPCEFVIGSRKVFRNKRMVVRDPKFDVTLEDAGYTSTKVATLVKGYIHEESLSSAVDQWNRRRAGGRYGSVGFTCYNHILKAHSHAAANKHSSIMGPCLQSVIITLHKNRDTYVDIFYRSTEVYKKFPADLVLVAEHMLSRFDFSENPLREIRFHFANVTVSPTYFGCILPHVEDPVGFMKEFALEDPTFHLSCCKCLFKYLDPATVAKGYTFNQSARASKGIRKLLSPSSQKVILSYLHKQLTAKQKGEDLDEDEE